MTRRFVSVEQAKRILGGEFVIFVGSAVSGVAPPHLPLVPHVLRAVLQPDPQAARTYCEAVLKSYRTALTGGHLQDALDAVKFEQFLWYVREASSESGLQRLLAELYRCDGSEYGVNHAAIATLLKARKALACFTTNFDNALELASGLTPIVWPDLPVTLPRSSEAPILVKLHGDVTLGNCIALTPQLGVAARRALYARLPELLRGQRVLVLGYSGTGDIDISPQLEQTDATFVWATPSRRPRDLPEWVMRRAHLILCDLRDVDVNAGTSKNLLLALSGRVSAPAAVHSWREKVSAWRTAEGLDVPMLISSVFGWRAHALHALRVFTDCRGGASPAFSASASAPLLVRVRAYKAALETCAEMERAGTALAPELLQSKGFALWRLGRLTEARSVLREAWQKSGGAGGTNLGRDIGRQYLEVCRDSLRRLPQRERLAASRSWKCVETVQALIAAHDTHASYSLLFEVVAFDLKRLTGHPVETTEIIRLMQEAHATKELESACACLWSLLPLALWEGLRHWLRATLPIVRARHWNYVQKNISAVFEAVFLEPLAGTPLVRRDGSRLAWVRGAFWDTRHRLRTNEWRRARNGWKSGQDPRV